MVEPDGPPQVRQVLQQAQAGDGLVAVQNSCYDFLFRSEIWQAPVVQVQGKSGKKGSEQVRQFFTGSTKNTSYLTR